MPSAPARAGINAVSMQQDRLFILSREPKNYMEWLNGYYSRLASVAGTIYYYYHLP